MKTGPGRDPGWIPPFELDPEAAASLPAEAPAPAARGRDRGGGAGLGPRGAAVPAPVAPGAIGPGRGRLWGRLFAVGLAAAALAALLDTAQGLAERVRDDPVTGWPMAILVGLAVASAASLLAREGVQLRRLQRRAALRARGRELAAAGGRGGAEGLLVEVAAGLEADGPRVAAALEASRRDGAGALVDAERLRLFERQVLVPIDARAYRLVLQSSRDIGLLTAISPYGLLDGLLVLWRTTIMVRSLARLYGIAPGPAATAALMKRCLRNAALAGLADVASQAVLEHAGASLASMFSARAGQGAGNALLAAKLGIEAIKESRPLPFVEADPPSLRQVRKALLGGGGARGVAAAGPAAAGAPDA